MHVTDWLPTFANLAGGLALPTFALDGVDQWDCLTSRSDCNRDEMVCESSVVLVVAVVGSFLSFVLFEHNFRTTISIIRQSGHPSLDEC